MPYLFEHLDSVEAIIKLRPFGFITDVDGTISETAPTPRQARISPLCRRYLAALSQHLPLVAAISGRPAQEVKDMIKIDSMVYIGNHGLERWTGGHSEFARDIQDYPGIINSVLKELTPLLNNIAGIIIENKGITASIHYRLCREPEQVAQQILAALRNLPPVKQLRILQDRMVVELLPPLVVNKGTAISDLIQEYNLQGGIYMGDDLTDIDAFQAMHSVSHNSDFKGLAIGIISQETPGGLVAEADFTLNGTGDVERFLKWVSQTALQLT